MWSNVLLPLPDSPVREQVFRLAPEAFGYPAEQANGHQVRRKTCADRLRIEAWASVNPSVVGNLFNKLAVRRKIERGVRFCAYASLQLQTSQLNWNLYRHCQTKRA